MATNKKDFNRFVESGTGINVIVPAKAAKGKAKKSTNAPKKAKRGK